MYLSPRSFTSSSLAPSSLDAPVKAMPASQHIALRRGYQPVYHLDIENRCPSCNKSNWFVGRFSAECAHCETALPLAMVASQPMQPRFTEHLSKTAMAVA